MIETTIIYKTICIKPALIENSRKYFIVSGDIHYTIKGDDVAFIITLLFYETRNILIVKAGIRFLQ